MVIVEATAIEPAGRIATDDLGLWCDEQIEPLSWHGRNANVFCVDFSVGGRWAERKAGTAPGTSYKLAALRWPERTLTFDDGSRLATRGFAGR